MPDAIQRYYFPTYYADHLVKIAEAGRLWADQRVEIASKPFLRRFDEHMTQVFQDALHRYRATVTTTANVADGHTLLKCEGADNSAAAPGHPLQICSATFYINEDYAGGDLVFPDQNLTIKPKAGDLIIRPAGHTPTVEPITRGVRYSVHCSYVFRP